MEYSWLGYIVSFLFIVYLIQKTWDTLYPGLRKMLLILVYYAIQGLNTIGLLQYIAPQTYFENKSNELIRDIETMFAKKGIKIQCIQVVMDVPLMRLIFLKDKEKLLPAYEKAVAYLIERNKLPGETYVRFERGCVTLLLPSEWFGIM